MLTSRKIPAFSKRVADLPDTPSSTMTAGQIKDQMDAAPEELRVAYNGAMDDLSSTTPGSSGAEQIGSAPILGVTGSTPYAQIADVKAQLNAATTGGIPDGSVTPAKLSFDPATQAELDAHTGATTGIHGATSAATANTMVVRDAGGRAQFASPSAASDAATKGYTDTALSSYSKFQYGSYTGNNTNNRTIPLTFTPKTVMVVGRIGSSAGAGTKTLSFFTPNVGLIDTLNNAVYSMNVIVTNGFRIGDTSGTAYAYNVSGEAYEYFAWG